MFDSSVSLGDLLRQERVRRGMSQADLARELGTTQQTVGRWEKGQTPQPRWMRRLQEFMEPPSPPAQVLRLSLTEPEEPARTLTPQQERVVDAAMERMRLGPMSTGEVDLLEATYRSVGLL